MTISSIARHTSKSTLADTSVTVLVQFFKDKNIKVVTVYPPATYTSMTTDRDDMEPVPEKEAQPSDIAKAAMLVRLNMHIMFLYAREPIYTYNYTYVVCWYIYI